MPEEKINAAGKDSVPAGYKTKMTGERWVQLPQYANMKFRAGSGGYTKNDLETGQIASLPLMRVEEMYFDYFSIAHTQGVEAAAQALQDFVNTYRYTDGSYKCKAKTMDDFITALMVQRRIELWGEGLVFFDYKRLNLSLSSAIMQAATTKPSYQLNSYAGYVAPWMNYMIPEDEKDRNPAVVLGPNPSGAITAE